jgi:hypothetical protein
MRPPLHSQLEVADVGSFCVVVVLEVTFEVMQGHGIKKKEINSK